MPQFTARMWDLPPCAAGFSGSGFFGARMWPITEPPVAPTLTVLAPLGGTIGTQTPWKGRLFLHPNSGNITRIIIDVAYPSGVYETVYVNALTPDYNGASSVILTAPGTYEMSILRNGGWPASPRIFVHANTDRGGMT